MEIKKTLKFDGETVKSFRYSDWDRENKEFIGGRIYIPKSVFKNGLVRPEEIEIIIKIPEK